MNRYIAENYNLKESDPVDRAVCAIVDDLTDRRGLRHEWDGIDYPIRLAIVDEWRRLIAREFAEQRAKGGGNGDR